LSRCTPRGELRDVGVSVGCASAVGALAGCAYGIRGRSSGFRGHAIGSGHVGGESGSGSVGSLYSGGSSDLNATGSGECATGYAVGAYWRMQGIWNALAWEGARAA